MILGIYGSPRRGGNSDILLDRVLGGAREVGAEVRKIYARDLAIAACTECGGCDETGVCVIDDRMQGVYPLLIEARAIVLASPVFFYGPSAQAKALIDRCQALWNRRRLATSRGGARARDGGAGYLLMVGAARGLYLFTGGELTAKYFFDALGKEYGGGIFFRAEAMGESMSRPGDLARARDFGAAIAARHEQEGRG